MTEGTSGMPMYTIRLASSSDGRSGGGPIRTPSTCVTPLAAAMRSSEAPSPAAMREPVGARRGAGVNAAAVIVSIIIGASVGRLDAIGDRQALVLYLPCQKNIVNILVTKFHQPFAI